MGQPCRFVGGVRSKLWRGGAERCGVWAEGGLSSSGKFGVGRGKATGLTKLGGDMAGL